MQFTRSAKSISTVAFSLVLAFGAMGLPGLTNESRSNSRQGLPGRRISGGVREGNCFTDFNQSLVAMMPRNNLGKTISARPAFWFSIPKSSGYSEVEFQLLNEADEIVYSTKLETSQSQGLSEFQLPDSAPELAVDTNYRWALSLGCSDTSRFVVQGWVRRVEVSASMAQKIKSASAEERVYLYAEAGLWHEQVTELVNLRRNNMTDMDFQLEWAALVESTGLASDISSNIAEAMSPRDATTVLIDASSSSRNARF